MIKASISKFAWFPDQKKEVLLRERKRHATRCVPSAPSVVLFGGVPHPFWGYPIPAGGYPIPSRGTPSLARGSTPYWGTPWEGTWGQSLGYPLERTLDQWNYCGMEMGYSLERT